jgi:hypothetical protein
MEKEVYMFFSLIYKNIMKHFIHPPDFCGEIFTKEREKLGEFTSVLSVNCVFSAYHFCESKKYWGTQKKTPQQNYLGCLSKCMFKFRKTYF